MGLLMSAGLMWLGVSLLIVTCPIATVGLFTVVLRTVQEELDTNAASASINNFSEGMRQHWHRGTKLAVANSICLLIISSSLWFYGTSRSIPQHWLIGPVIMIGLTWAGSQMYMFPLCVSRTELSASQVFREGCLIAICHPLITGGVMLSVAAFAVGVAILAGPIILVFIVFIAIVQTLALRAILVQRGEIAWSTCETS